MQRIYGDSDRSGDTLEMVVRMFEFMSVDGVTVRMFDTSPDDESTADLAAEVEVI